MARVTYGGGVSEFKGSIGGVTFQRNTSGPIIKLRTIFPVNPSPFQSPKQQRLSFLVSSWSLLSQANKDLWDAFALAHDHTTPWGDVKTLSGYQWFLSVNLYRLIHHSTILSSPPTWTAYDPPDQFTIECTSTYIKVLWDPGYDATSLMAYVSLPLRQSSLKLRRPMFFCKYYFASPELSEWDLTTEVSTLYNVTWADFFASADCHIIIRILNGSFNSGLFSSFTSAITKIE